MGYPTKYDTVVLPRWDWIKEQAERGLPEQEIYKALGVSRQSWITYKNKHKELFDIFDISKSDSPRAKAIEENCQEVKNVIFERATGKSCEVNEKVYEVEYPDGKKMRHTEKTKKYALPDMTAAFGYLNLYDPTYAKDKANIELRKREVAIKEKLADMAENDDKIININIT